VRAGRAAATLLALALAGAAPAGCGEDDEPPQGPPAARHGEGPIRDLLAVQAVGARLEAAADQAAKGSFPDAREQLRLARRGYGRVSPRVAGEDAVLDREVRAALGAVDAALARRDPPAAVGERINPLKGQLLDGVEDALVERRVRNDSGLRAEVASRGLDAFEREYAAAVRDGPRGRGRLAFQHSYGLMVKSLGKVLSIADELGAQRGPVLVDLIALRDRTFPSQSAAPPAPRPAAEVISAADRAQRGLAERWGLRAP
jgi:hypothetical protein